MMKKMKNATKKISTFTGTTQSASTFKFGVIFMLKLITMFTLGFATLFIGGFAYKNLGDLVGLGVGLFIGVASFYTYRTRMYPVKKISKVIDAVIATHFQVGFIAAGSYFTVLASQHVATTYNNSLGWAVLFGAATIAVVLFQRLHAIHFAEESKQNERI